MLLRLSPLPLYLLLVHVTKLKLQKKEISTIAKDGEEIDPPKQTIPSV
jgi:hypothetical protein